MNKYTAKVKNKQSDKQRQAKIWGDRRINGVMKMGGEFINGRNSKQMCIF